MDTYHLKIALGGRLRDKQLWTNAKKTHEDLAIIAIPTFVCASSIHPSGIDKLELHGVWNLSLALMLAFNGFRDTRDKALQRGFVKHTYTFDLKIRGCELRCFTMT